MTLKDFKAYIEKQKTKGRSLTDIAFEDFGVDRSHIYHRLQKARRTPNEKCDLVLQRTK